MKYFSNKNLISENMIYSTTRACYLLSGAKKSAYIHLRTHAHTHTRVRERKEERERERERERQLVKLENGDEMESREGEPLMKENNLTRLRKKITH